MNCSSVRYRPIPSAPDSVKMRHVGDQPGIDLEVNLHAVPGHCRLRAKRGILGLLSRIEAHLLRVCALYARGRADVDFAGLRIEDDRVAGVDQLDQSRYLANRRNPERPRDDRHMTGLRHLFDDDPAQVSTVVVEKFRRPHVARHENGILRQDALAPRSRAVRSECAAAGSQDRRGR